jgi:hypothetical protein
MPFKIISVKIIRFNFLPLIKAANISAKAKLKKLK